MNVSKITVYLVTGYFQFVVCYEYKFLFLAFVESDFSEIGLKKNPFVSIQNLASKFNYGDKAQGFIAMIQQRN